MAQEHNYKLADYFAIVGLDEELKSYDCSQEGKFPHFSEPIWHLSRSLFLLH